MRFLFVFKSIEWLGIEYLSAALKKAGHQTDLAFEIGLEGTFYFKSRRTDHSSIMGRISSFKPDMILFSSTTNLFPWVSEVAKEIKKHFSVPIMVGGIHATIQPERVLNNENIDMVCLGEGEEAIVELANKVEKKYDFDDTQNIWFKRNNILIKNLARPLINDLDSLPFPDKDLFYQYGCFTDRIYVMTGRGCPYNCSYCFNHQLKNLYRKTPVNYVRRRSVASVIEELKFYKKKYKAKSVHFYDDTFVLNNDWVMDFCDRYKKDINLPFYCLVRANLVTNDLIQALRTAGCVSVGMGIESGNERVRNEILRRHMSNEQIEQAANIIKENKIKLVTFNIFGIPGETMSDLLDTMKINLQIRPDSLFTYTFYPFPETDLMKAALEQNLINDEGYKKIVAGEGDYQSRSLLQSQTRDVAYNMKVILALLNKLPKFCQGYFLGKWVYKKHSEAILSLIKVLSIPFYSAWEAKGRLKEQISMFKVYYSRKFKKWLTV